MRLADNGVGLSVGHADERRNLITAKHVTAALPPRVLQATVKFKSAQEPETVKRSPAGAG
jgi:hypothetical protein